MEQFVGGHHRRLRTRGRRSAAGSASSSATTTIRRWIPFSGAYSGCAAGRGVPPRNVTGGCLLATRVLGHYRGNGVSAEDTQFIPMMMNWVVEPIPAMHIPPALPAEVPLPDAMLTWRAIEYVWLNADGDIITKGWYPFAGRSLLRLSTKLAVCLSMEWGMEGVPDIVICLPARGGRLLPLVVDLPSSEHNLLRVIVVYAGSPGEKP
uniref:DUF569 domain-containing protein n=1 Tax=Aegilops tauschii TaxID=37682 RepID=M8BCZ5_AEGTA